MRIALIGAPGSGKTFVGKELSKLLNIPHIEVDQIYWSGADLREEIKTKVQEEAWIVEGHMSKIADLVLPRAQKLIKIEYPEFLSLLRSMKRDWKRPKKFFHNLQHYEKLKSKREALVNEFKRERKQDFLILDNFSKPLQSELATLRKRLKAPTL
jgi:adenylate kinase family enzyme